jgi:hypothetical protein
VEHGDRLLGQGANIFLDQIGAQYNAQSPAAQPKPEEGESENEG